MVFRKLISYRLGVWVPPGCMVNKPVFLSQSCLRPRAMAERTSPVFLVISSQVGWIVWVDLHSAAAAVVPFLTSHNGYYVNLLAGPKKGPAPLNQDRAQGRN